MAIKDAAVAREKREKEEMEALKKKMTDTSNKNKRNPNMQSGYVLQSPKYKKRAKANEKET
jgi:uncharacterized protein HemY